MILLADDQVAHTELLGETFGHAVIDSGCTRTVCGRTWLDSYIETLSRSDTLLIEKHADEAKFRFGDSEVILSTELVVIPVYFGSQQVRLMTNVVDRDLPLLISRESLKRAEAEIDFKNDRVNLLGEQVNVVISQSGHLCIPLIQKCVKQCVKQVLFSSPLQVNDDKANEKKISKLHKQFAHPSSDKLKQLIHNSGVTDADIDKTVDNVTSRCDICKRYRRPPPRPVVGFSLSTEFNEVVAMDIKFLDGVPILHMIDHATRYSMASRVRNKKPETIVECVLNNWIRIFGHPKYFLTDNGGEFINATMLELCEKFNIELKTTAAESAWSNGLVERHNAIIGNNVSKIMADQKCSIDMAIPWAICAKNSLSSVYGFAPNQLVFGRNINLPTVHTDKLPAQNDTCVSGRISKHLMALHTARQAFVAQESCEKLRRALNRQTRSFSDIVYQNGDKVYYKRNNNTEWHGPAKVLGNDGSQYLLKHGGSYVRVHPCKMQKVSLPDLANQVSNKVTQSDESSCVQEVKDGLTQENVRENLRSNPSDAFPRHSQCNQNLQYDSDSDEEYNSSNQLPRVPPTPPPTPAQVFVPNQGNDVPAVHVAPIVLDYDVHDAGFDVSMNQREADDKDSGPDVNVSEKGPDVSMSEKVAQASGNDVTTGQDKPPLARSRLDDFNKPPLQYSQGPNQVSNISADHGTTTVKSTKDLPTPSTSITYRQEGQEEWNQAQVLSNAGKKNTGSWHYMNLKPQSEEAACCVSLKGAEWKEHPPDIEPECHEDVYFGSATDSSRFLGAKQAELEKWQEFQTYKEVPDTGQPRISSKWVCTEKVKGGQLVTKARLVARGFEEDQSQLRTDSPTCSKESLRMMLSVLASKKWSLQSIDIKSAYLQGNDITRDIYLKPPKEAKTKMLWKLERTPYGLVDAGRQWYIKVQKEFTALGAQPSKCDRAVFIWGDSSGSGPCGILLAHVDDFLYGGDRSFQENIIPQLRSIFQVGAEEEGRFRYLGLNVSQVPQGIKLSLEEYCESLREIETAKLGVDRSRLLEPAESSELKHLIGQINWVSTQSRPDVSYDSCILGGRVSKATVADVHQANKVIRKIRGRTLDLIFPENLDLTTVRLICFCDASFANLANRGSQGAFLIFMADATGIFSLICWQSKRVKRTVNSTLSAECLSAVDAAETCILIRDRLEEMLCLTSGIIKITLVTDNRSLVDAVHKSTSVENKRLQIDVNMLREMVERDEISEFRWISTEHQMANALTKQGASSDHLLHTLLGSSKYDHNTGMFM